MTNFIKKLRTAFLVILIAFATVITNITGVSAWGPAGRATFTCESPATYTTFNSITNRPLNNSSDCDQSGGTMDERYFVLVCEAGASTNGCTGNYVDDIAVEVGKTYQVYIYFHNNAADNLNPGVVSHNARVSTVLPSKLRAGERTPISGVIYADNSNPVSVWDETYVTSPSDVDLRYYLGSATIHSNGAVNGSVLPANDPGNANGDLLNGGTQGETGAFIGYDSLNGAVPGCAQYSGWVTYRFIVDQPGFSVQKTVSADGNNFAERATVRAGEEVMFKIVYTNTGTEDQLDVNIKDELPSGLAYVPGSTRIVNPENPNGLKLSDNITTEGIDIGNYGPGASAEVTFKAKATGKDNLVCGRNNLVNNAKAITSNGTINDTAEVEIIVSCAPDSGEVVLRNAAVAGAAVIILLVTAWLIGRRQKSKG